MATPTLFAKRVATVAQDQHTQFQFTYEADPTLCKQIKKWTVDIGFPFSSCTNVPWSAVFVSWCVKKAGATADEFKFAMAHSVFVNKAIKNALNGEGVFHGLASFILGIFIAYAFDIEILKTLKITTDSNSGPDLFVTALIISAGTEGANSSVKLLQYLKDAVKKKTPASVEQQSPVPQAPSKPVSSEQFLVEFNSSDQVGSETAERTLPVQSRAKEQDYDAQ